MTLATPTMFLPVPMAAVHATEYLGMWVAAAAGAVFVIVSSRVTRRATTLLGVQLLLWSAATAYVFSWFLPVFEDGVAVPGGLSGWEAVRAVMSPLWNPHKFVEHPWFALVGIATGLSNVFMIIALSNLHYSRMASANRWKPWALVAAAINTSWIGMDWPDHDFRIGYYLWLLSFLLLAVVVWARSTRTEQKGAIGRDSRSGSENSGALASP